MKIFTFKGGIHPPSHKDISICEHLKIVPELDTYIIPLSQHIGACNNPIVKKGDIVEEGDVLGENDAFVSSPVHSPVFGKVIDIKKMFHPVLGPTMSVIIERDKDKESKVYSKQDIGDVSSSDLLQKIRKLGIIGMGGASFPTHVKLSVPKEKKVKDLIINAAECEPYLTCDHLLMNLKKNEILKGIAVIAKILNPDNIYIAIEDNKKSAIFSFQKLIKEQKNMFQCNIEVVVLKTKYPQGGEKQLIKAILNKEVPFGKLPLDVNVMVNNVSTVYAIYEAIYFNKALIERIITISGDCVDKPGNYVLKIGAKIKDIIELCNLSFSKKVNKIIMGGPMMGFSQVSDESVILKNSSGILFLSKDVAKSFEETECIKCGKCVDVCPMRLVPTSIVKNIKNKDFLELNDLNIRDCMECGSCTYVCPARIPIVQYIREGKSFV